VGIASGGLFGPDVSDEYDGADIPEEGDRVGVWSAQFVNRWVFLKHQRPAALAELDRLIAEARKPGGTGVDS